MHFRWQQQQQQEEEEKGGHHLENINGNSSSMVQGVFGAVRYNKNRAIHVFLSVVTLLILSSCCVAAASFPKDSVSGGTIWPQFDYPHQEGKEPCAFTLDLHVQGSPPCRTKSRIFLNGVVTNQELGSQVDGRTSTLEWRAQKYRSDSAEEVDVRGRNGRHTFAEDRVVGAARQASGQEEEQNFARVVGGVGREYAAKSRQIEGAERRWLRSEADCVKHIRGQKFGSCQNSPATGGAAFGVLRAARSVASTTYDVQPDEAQVLLSWRAPLEPQGRKNVFANWNLTTEPKFCNWQGVDCRNISQQEHVVSINLAGKKISGPISSGLSGLPFLDTLDLSYNRLTGAIPEDLANISSLRILNVGFNKLNGAIPAFGAGINSCGLQSLNLAKNKLREGVPASLGQCKQLEELNFARNYLSGGIPSELGTLTNLTRLILDQNTLNDTLPASLGSCTNLVNISLGWNQLTGRIPDQYSSLEALQGLYLDGNKLTGDLPTWLSALPNLTDLHLSKNGFRGSIPTLLLNSTTLRSLNLSNNTLEGRIPATLPGNWSLVEIDLSMNHLNGTIPNELGYLEKLQQLHLEQNLLTGFIPYSLGNCYELREIVLSSNQLGGPILRLDTFRDLQILSLDDNQLNGTIPDSVTECVNLTVLELSNNGLVGAIPGNFSQLKNLTSLGLSGNSLAGSLPDELGRLTSLQSLALERNLFDGPIPVWLGNFEQLKTLTLGSNRFTGSIPPQLSQCIHLMTLALDNNSLNGSIPNSIGHLRSLSVLHLQGNSLSGSIPTSFMNFTHLQDFVISDNELIGPISSSLLSILSQLTANFSVANNDLKGPLPPELGLLTQVRTMNLSGNGFSGDIPDKIGNCTKLERLDLAENDLRGIIPPSIGKLSALQFLSVSHNTLGGSIPATAVGALAQLEHLDLSANNLSGEIPSSLSSLPKLAFLNVSDNILQGPVPETGPFLNFNASSFLDNPDLCGPILQRSCDGSGKRSLSNAATISIAASVAGFVVLIVVGGFLWWRVVPWEKTPEKTGSIIARSELFYPQLRFTVQDLKLATENFSDVNVLGAGSLSNVYRGVLPELVLVAVKKLRMPSGTEIPPAFVEELDELGKLRHRHLVAILGHCFDSEMNALVVQFMSNGSLEEHLHRGQSCELEWPTRAKISIGVAKALTYLHHDCGTAIVHCDLKPSNVLLDADYDAHLEDFGLSRLIFAHKLIDMTNSSVGSSMGYFPPEYGYSPTVSPKGDVYSFGILLMEMLTGKKPTLDMFKDDMSLTKWCQASFPNKTLDVLDPVLIGSKETNFKQVNLFMKVALMCAKDTPEDRPTMKSVLELLR